MQGMPALEGHNCPLRRHGDEVERLPGGFYVAHGRCDDTMNLAGIKVLIQLDCRPNVAPNLCRSCLSCWTHSACFCLFTYLLVRIKSQQGTNAIHWACSEQSVQSVLFH